VTPLHGMSFLLAFCAAMIGSLCALMIVFGSAQQMVPRLNRVLLLLSTLALSCFGL
jgi:ABC-type Fe3+ transport system permease subunit